MAEPSYADQSAEASESRREEEDQQQQQAIDVSQEEGIAPPDHLPLQECEDNDDDDFSDFAHADPAFKENPCDPGGEGTSAWAAAAGVEDNFADFQDASFSTNEDQHDEWPSAAVAAPPPPDPPPPCLPAVASPTTIDHKVRCAFTLTEPACDEAIEDSKDLLTRSLVDDQ